MYYDAYDAYCYAYYAYDYAYFAYYYAYTKRAGIRNPWVSQGTLATLRFLGLSPQIIRSLPRK